MSVALNATNFPDSAFRQFVSSTFDTDSDGILSDSELQNIIDIRLKHDDYQLIKSIKGIEFFTYLKVLTLYDYPEIDYIDLSVYPNLEEFRCDNCGFISLDFSGNNSITTIHCQRCTEITSIILGNKASLKIVKASYNTALNTIDVSGCVNLEVLELSNSNLTSINISNCTKLYSLDLFHVNLSTLDITNCPVLIDCYRNVTMSMVTSNDTIQKIYRRTNAEREGGYEGFGTMLFTTIVDGQEPPSVSLNLCMSPANYDINSYGKYYVTGSNFEDWIEYDGSYSAKLTYLEGFDTVTLYDEATGEFYSEETVRTGNKRICFRIYVEDPSIIPFIKSLDISFGAYLAGSLSQNDLPDEDDLKRTISGAIGMAAWPEEEQIATTRFSMATATTEVTLPYSQLYSNDGFDEWDITSIQKVTLHFDNLTKNSSYYTGNYLYVWISFGAKDEIYTRSLKKYYRDGKERTVDEQCTPSLNIRFSHKVQAPSSYTTRSAQFDYIKENLGYPCGVYASSTWWCIPNGYGVSNVETYNLDIVKSNNTAIIGNNYRFDIQHTVGGKYLTLIFSAGDAGLGSFGIVSQDGNTPVTLTFPSEWLIENNEFVISREITVTVSEYTGRTASTSFVLSIGSLLLEITSSNVINGNAQLLRFTNRFNSSVQIDLYYNEYLIKSISSSEDNMSFSLLTSELNLPDNDDGYIYPIHIKAVDTFGREAVGDYNLCLLPEITAQPNDITVIDGENATFSIVAYRGSEFAYRWQESTDDGQTWKTISLLSGRQNPFVFKPDYSNNNNRYRCAVSNDNSNHFVFSDFATLTVITRPSFTSDLEDVFTTIGASIEMSVSVIGGGTPHYCWQTNVGNGEWIDIEAPDSPSLIIETVTDEIDGNQYRCHVTNVAGDAYSRESTLTVERMPVIVTQPIRTIAADGSSAKFIVSASGINLSYQWQVSTDGGTTWYEDAVNGSTNGGSISEYTIAATESMDRYQYRCVVSNLAGAKTSNPAELRVLAKAPSIITQPQDVTVETSENAVFSIAADGDELSFKWQDSADSGETWSDIDGATSANYSFIAEKSCNGNKYRCVVANVVGTRTSEFATLTVMDPPVIKGHPSPITVRDGENINHQITATGDNISCQWQVSTDNGTNWDDVAGETSDTYSFTALFAMNGNMYRCKVYNDVKTVYTEPALLTVTIQPSITTQPQDTRIASGSNAVFSVEATDREGAGLAYTWQVKESENGEWIAVSGDAYSGNSTASLTVTASADIDGYQYRCFIEGGHDSIMSESAAIDVVTLPVITGELQNTTIRSGSPVSFTASAEGKYTSYQWQTYLHERWVNIDGAANDTYTLIQENPAETGIGTVMYRYTVTNIAGTVASSAATVTVIPSIVITSQPLSAESPAGGVVRFTVGAAGERLRYRWQTRGRSSSAWSNVNGELYEGETTQTLSVSVEIVLSGNQYRCIITDGYSDSYPLLAQSVTSDAAILTTSSLQVSLTQPIDTTVAAGDLASFEVIADDEGYAYQWQVSADGGDTWSNIQNNGNSPVYVFTANADQSGAKFCCVVTSDRWAVISSAATLTVATEPVIESEPQDARVGEDKSAEFHIGASGVELQYQWQISTDGINWADIPDDRAKTDTISVTAAMQADGNRYRCKVYNIAGTVYSWDAVLSVIEKIRILANPEDQVAANGDTVSFSVSVSGYSPGYQWQEKAADSDVWINVQDASAAGITLNVTANEQSNGKRYRCIIMNDAGEETSAPALLTVYFKPVFTVQPYGGDVDESSVVSLHAEANGGGVSYQWQSKRENGTYWSDLTIDGATSDTLPLTAHVAINGIQYRCVATNLAGATESESATFHVDVTSFCLADGSEIDEGVLPAGYYTFNLNADRKGVVYDIGLFDGANTDWIVVEASSARTFYTNGRKAIKILFHHTDNADLEFYAIRPMLEEGQEAHQWVSPANAAYEHDAANDFNYGWFSIGNKYGDRENIVTASAPCVMTLRYRPIWKDTL